MVADDDRVVEVDVIDETTPVDVIDVACNGAVPFGFVAVTEKLAADAAADDAISFVLLAFTLTLALLLLAGLLLVAVELLELLRGCC